MTKKQAVRILKCDARFAAHSIGFLRYHNGNPLAAVRDAREMATLDTEGAQFWLDVADYLVAVHRV